MKTVFLDIDGVLQPYNSNNSFKYIDDISLINELSDKYKVDYSKYSIYDVYASYYDWNIDAINRLKYILDVTDSRIIVSSDWRTYNSSKMVDLLKIHELDKYYLCDNIICDFIFPYDKKRAYEIDYSIDKYKINNYVILDDMNLYKYFPINFVKCNNYLSLDNMNKAIKILRKK